MGTFMFMVKPRPKEYHPKFTPPAKSESFHRILMGRRERLESSPGHAYDKKDGI